MPLLGLDCFQSLQDAAAAEARCEQELAGARATAASAQVRTMLFGLFHPPGQAPFE